MTEKLNYDDGYIGEILVNKINELIDRVDALEDRLGTRMDKHWAYHRYKAIEEGKFIPTDSTVIEGKKEEKEKRKAKQNGTSESKVG